MSRVEADPQPGLEWRRKGATLSDKTARQEFGLTQTQILRGVQAGKLQYRLRVVNGALMDHTLERTASLGDVYRIMFSIRYTF